MRNPEFLVDNSVTLYHKDDKTFQQQGIELFQTAMRAYPEYDTSDFTWVYELDENSSFTDEARLRIAIKNPNYIPLKLPFTRLEFILGSIILGDFLLHVVYYH